MGLLPDAFYRESSENERDADMRSMLKKKSRTEVNTEFGKKEKGK